MAVNFASLSLILAHAGHNHLPWWVVGGSVWVTIAILVLVFGLASWVLHSLGVAKDWIMIVLLTSLVLTAVIYWQPASVVSAVAIGAGFILAFAMTLISIAPSQPK